MPESRSKPKVVESAGIVKMLLVAASCVSALVGCIQSGTVPLGTLGSVPAANDGGSGHMNLAQVVVVDSSDPEGVTASGVRVRLVGISNELEFLPNERVDEHTWSPDGGPYRGGQIAYQPVRSGPLFRPTESSVRLTISLAVPRREDLDVSDYVPGGSYDELREIDTSEPEKLPDASGNRLDSILVNLSRPSDRFCYGVADGPWHQVAESDTSHMSPEGSGIIASGPWGALKMTGLREQDQLGTEGKRVMPRVMFEVIPSTEPRQFAYRIRQFDSAGNELYAGWISYTERTTSGSARDFDKVARVTVEARSYTWIEFRNVHFDSPPKYFVGAYFGHGGDASVVRDPSTGIELLGFVKTELRGGFWAPAGDYAPDGRRWIDFPEWQRAEGFSYPAQGVATPPIHAVLNLGAYATGPTAPPTVDVFESSSASPGQGLGRLIQSAKIFDSAGPTQGFFFAQPSGIKSIQLRLRLPERDWKTVVEIKPPHVPMMRVRPQDLSAYDKGAVLNTVYRLTVRASGEVDDSYLSPDEHWVWPHQLKHAVQNETAKVVARMKDGSLHVLTANSYSALGDRDYEFDLTRDSRQLLRGVKELYLDQVDALEIQDESYTRPVFLPAVLP